MTSPNTPMAFVTHPSVRIKGTENTYTPSHCVDDQCPVKPPHMHCPLCVKSDVYTDPVILKAHYRVKHVDKGIEFAGLKILRCIDTCDIVGIIKGEKRFKGAHWHCYRCKNGFNRRDEAIKHYKTHFRNPQTTFQIQITQDLNAPPASKPPICQENRSSSLQSFNQRLSQEISREALLQQTPVVSVTENKLAQVKVEPGERGLDQQTIMIIQQPGHQPDPGFPVNVTPSSLSTTGPAQAKPADLDTPLQDWTPVVDKSNFDASAWEIRFRLEEEEKNLYKARAEELKAQVDSLQQQVAMIHGELLALRQAQSQGVVTCLVPAAPPGEATKVSRAALTAQLTRLLDQVTGGQQPQQQQTRGLSFSPSISNISSTLFTTSPMTPLNEVAATQLTSASDLSHHQVLTASEPMVLSATPEGHYIVSKPRVSALTSEDDAITMTTDAAQLLHVAITNESDLSKSIVQGDNILSDVAPEVAIVVQEPTQTDQEIIVNPVVGPDGDMQEITVRSKDNFEVVTVPSDQSQTISLTSDSEPKCNTNDITNDLTSETSVLSKDQNYVLDMPETSEIFIEAEPILTSNNEQNQEKNSQLDKSVLNNETASPTQNTINDVDENEGPTRVKKMRIS